ncbi:MAG: hypothetical protein BWY57_03289 [Betaproteobacteria bacterium ADurb.Bin341]|jgi:hypothetical protein|nr:MAG: hypothetical protein BWY57_03289 [Betaproteobacteria bacterium ADurb.Bin341]
MAVHSTYILNLIVAEVGNGLPINEEEILHV